MLTPKDKSIIAQVAMKCASNIFCAQPEEALQGLTSVYELIFCQLLSDSDDGSPAPTPVAPILGAFPDAQVVPNNGGLTSAYVPPTSIPAPLPQPVPLQAVPAVAVGFDIETRWREFFADPSQWYDNRTSKNSAASPDFRHKSKLDAKGKSVSLWINSKYDPTPPWVLSQLGLAVA